MADSGGESMLKCGQDEYFDWKCRVCEEEGLIKEATAYCKHCDECFCRPCFKYHERFNKSHAVLGEKEKADWGKSEQKRDTGISCSDHHGQTITMFCGLHDVLCCPVCVAIKHSESCKPTISYIPDVAPGITGGTEFSAVINDTDSLMSSVKALTQGRRVLKTKLNTSRRECSQKIGKFHTELAIHLNTIKAQSISEMNKGHDEMLQQVEEDLTTCMKLEQNLQEMKEQLNPSGSINESLMFVRMKNGLKSLPNYKDTIDRIAALERHTFKFIQSDSLNKHICSTRLLGECVGVAHKSKQNQPSDLSNYRKVLILKSSEKVKQNLVRSKPASHQDHDDETRSPRVDEQHFTDSHRGQKPGGIDDLSTRKGSQSLKDTDRSDKKQIGNKHTDRARDLSSSTNNMVNDGTVPASKKRISWPQSHPKSVVEWFISDILKKYRKETFEFNILDDCMLYDGPDELDSVFRTEFKTARQKLSSDLQRDHLDVSASTVTIHIDREGETDSGVFILHVPMHKIINFYGKNWTDIQIVKGMFQAKLFPKTFTTRKDRQLCTKESPENDLDTPSANDQSKINVCSATSGTENGARQKTSKGMRGKSTVPDFQRQFSWAVDANNLEVFKVNNVTVKVYFADILSVPVDCIVNAANSQLNHQGGVAKVIAKAAGRKLTEEGEDYIKRHGLLNCGQACETSAGKLPYHHVIHTVGPCWSWYKPYSQTDVERCEFDLCMAIKNSLSRAEHLRHSSIAIPAVSSGKFGCPEGFCAVQYARAILEYVDSSRSPLQEIHFVDTDKDMVMLIQKVFRSMTRNRKPPKDYDVKRYVCTLVANTQTHKEKKNYN